MQLIRLIWPVILVVVISLFALIAVAGFFANQYDQAAETTQRTIIKTATGKISHNLTVLAEDNSWWDDAVDNVVLEQNTNWMHRIFGDVSSSRNYVDGTIVIHPDSSVVYHSGSDDDLRALPNWLDAGLQEAINNMDFVNGNIGATAQGFLKYNDNLIALGISMVQPSGYKVYDPPLSANRRPVLVLYQHMGREEYAELANATGVSSLQFSPAELENKRSALRIMDINGDVVGSIMWRQRLPGNDLLRDLAVPASILLVIVMLTAAYFMYQARTLIKDLEHANNAKMSFLASMSHEVRTPLNTIIGFAEIVGMELYGKLEGTKNKEYMKIIRNSGEHLLSIVNDILDISKLEADRFELHVEPVDAQDIIEQCLNIVAVPADEKSIRIVSDIASVTIESDARIMRQTLINVLSNAIKFTPKGGQVSVLSEQKGKYFVITVSDNGPGMTQEEIHVALEPFGQITPNNIKAGTGTGLGLPIVERFMKLIGGKLTIRSAPGYGTSVSLEFPNKDVT
ncbi:sensor histidine kinase [Kordiimonas aquimaris]|uniref:sensor histidine kinase n=1 Tax=Kordiimonas aquimaris TaxID=707591 RepID=UPI0021CEDAEA|nr:ATP-binding protein [Kordiimonas aquimaris]